MKKVFVSGCYDILHAGHLQFFEEARALGDYLIVSFASAEVLWHHKRRKPSIPDEHKMALLKGLRMVDEVIISHGHNDHTGGLPEALKACGRRVPVILHPDALLPKLKTVPILRTIGAPNRWDQVGETGCLLATREPVQLVAGVQTSGEIPRTTAFEGPEEFHTLRDGRLERDDMRDDLALFIHLPDVGLVVVTGCAHAGIVNTIRHGLALTGATRLRAVIGGFHLIRATPDRIQQTIEALDALQPELLVPIHCTGDRAVAELARAFGERVRYAYVGSELRVESDGSVTI